METDGKLSGSWAKPWQEHALGCWVEEGGQCVVVAPLPFLLPLHTPAYPATLPHLTRFQSSTHRLPPMLLSLPHSSSHPIPSHPGPAPPAGTGHHRYIFTLYEQKGRIEVGAVSHFNDTASASACHTWRLY